MTKFFLHWWSTSKESSENKDFFDLIFKNYSESEIILYIPFAREQNEWSIDKFKSNLNLYSDNNYNIVLANQNQSELLKQISESDYIYIWWWDYKLLHDKLSFMKNHSNIFLHKTIIWSSAWVNILAKYSYSNDYSEVLEWLWILNIKTMCHYKWELDKKNILENFWEKLRVYLIKDMEYIILD